MISRVDFDPEVFMTFNPRQNKSRRATGRLTRREKQTASNANYKPKW